MMVNNGNGREWFEDPSNVSRETLEKLEHYAVLLKKWNRAINLVSPSTLSELWTRHFLDSAQLADIIPNDAETWCDIGSGAGFPGLVVSCLIPELRVTCVESDERKSVFLQTIARELSLNAVVITERVENVVQLDCDVLSARALAPLSDLLEHADRHLKKSGRAIFLKGNTHLAEIEEARKAWAFDIEIYPSKTNPQAAVLSLGDIERE